MEDEQAERTQRLQRARDAAQEATPNNCDDVYAALGRIFREWRAEAIAADPGLMRAVRLAQELDPDVGWVDVAVDREQDRDAKRLARKSNPHLTAYLGGLP